MADYNSDRTGSNIDLTLDKVDALDAKVQPTATGVDVKGDVSFYEDTGTTAKMVWDASAENLNITSSTGSPEVSLSSDSNTTALKLDNTATSGRAFQIMSHGGGSSLASKLSIYDEDAGLHRFVLDSAGNVGIGTASPSAKLDVVGDINVSGGVYLGGAGAANKLDDYETGEFDLVITPSISGTVTLNTSFDKGSYTKIGNKVTCTGLAIVSAASAPTGDIRVNLPFAIVNGTDRRGDVGVSLSVNNVTSGSCGDISGAGNDGNAYFALKDGSATTLSTFDSKLSSSTQIYFSITYITSA